MRAITRTPGRQSGASVAIAVASKESNVNVVPNRAEHCRRFSSSSAPRSATSMSGMTTVPSLCSCVCCSCSWVIDSASTHGPPKCAKWATSRERSFAMKSS